MAILAMDQFAQIVLDRQERLVPARSLDEIEHAQQDGKIPVWLPSALAIPAPDIRACWDITSDSLAAWIAGKLGAEALLLIKQTSAFTGDDDVDSLTARGIVDAGLAGMLPPGVDLHLAGPDDAAAAAAWPCQPENCREHGCRDPPPSERRDSPWRSCIRRAGHGS